MRDTRNLYDVYLNGRLRTSVRGHRDALAERRRLMEEHARGCCSSICPCSSILDTPAVSQCCGCSCYCIATVSKVARHA